MLKLKLWLLLFLDKMQLNENVCAKCSQRLKLKFICKSIVAADLIPTCNPNARKMRL